MTDEIDETDGIDLRPILAKAVSDLMSWPKAERMAFLQCRCGHCDCNPEDWQAAKVAGRLCARCSFIIDPPK